MTFDNYEELLDRFIEKVDSIKKYMKDVNFDIDKLKNEFMDYIRKYEIEDAYKFNFVILNVKLNPLCDIVRMMMNETEDEVNRIVGILIDFEKYTANVVRGIYNRKDAGSDGPCCGTIKENFIYDYDKNKKLSYDKLDDSIKWYIKLTCRWKIQDDINFETICKYKNLFEMVVYPMCAKRSYELFKANPS